MRDNFFRLCFISALLLCVLACEPLETGDPPTFPQGFNAAAISESQIQLSWQAGADDLNDPDELIYGIWIAAEGETLDLEDKEDFLTKEGVLGFSVTNLGPGTAGLAPDTNYQVLVRARDRGSVYSAATASDIKTIKTTAKGSGSFGEDYTINTSIEADDMIGGVVFNGERDDIGLVEGGNINWYETAAIGSLAPPETSPRLNIGETVRDAHLARVRIGKSWDDLLVTTEAAFYYYENSGSGFSNRTTPFQGVADEGSIRFGYIKGNFEAMGYIAGATDAYIYTMDDDEKWSTTPASFIVSNNSVFDLADIDNDDDLDVIIFSASGLATRINEGDEDTPYDLANSVAIDSDLPRNASEDVLLLGDGDNDGNVDVYVFTRDSVAGTTTLRFYKGEGDGTFADGSDFDMRGSVYSQPRLEDVRGPAAPEFLALQANSNNVAMHSPATNGNFSNVTFYLGGRDQADFYYFGDINSEAGKDLVLYSNKSGNRGFTVVPGAPSANDPDDFLDSDSSDEPVIP